MWKDPIVEEIHAVREQIARECDYDLKRILDYLRAREEKYPGPILSKAELAARRMGVPLVGAGSTDDG